MNSQFVDLFKMVEKKEKKKSGSPKKFGRNAYHVAIAYYIYMNNVRYINQLYLPLQISKVSEGNDLDEEKYDPTF